MPPLPPHHDSGAATTTPAPVTVHPESLDDLSVLPGGQKRGVFDRRHPLYLGDWKRATPATHDKFAQDDLDEPHFKRRKVILREHPEIAQLYGYDTRTIWNTVIVVLVQVTLAYLFGRVFTDSIWFMLFTAYAVGGSMVSIVSVIVHECTHNLAAASPLANRFCALVANIIVPVPVAMSFRRYHLEHHTYQGVYGRDPDLPFDWEVRLIRGNPLTKIVWIFIYPIMYASRGLLQGKSMSNWEKYNWIWTVASNIFIYQLTGVRGLLYLCVGAWSGFSIHFGAAHFIQEHYTYVDGQETYSYYGSGNHLFMNIGYHNEHHDFARVPWSRLPEVRKIAPEYYDTLFYHTSWWKVLWSFITDPNLGAVSRVTRTEVDHWRARQMVREHRK